MPENDKGQKEIKLENKVNLKVWKIFFWEVFLFSITLVLGIFTAFRISNFLEIQEIVLPQVSLWRFVVYFLIVTLFLLSISYFIKVKKRKGAIFRVLFILTVFLGGLFFLEAWLPAPFPLILIIFLIFWWHKCPSVLTQDILMILGIIGMGATLGLAFQPWAIVILLIVFSIYDFIAVYKTKHMVKMAKEMTEAGAILGLILPSNISDFKAKFKKVSFGGRFLILGGGDIIFPLILCVSLITQGLIYSLIVAFFSLLGLALSFYFFISQKKRQPIPALPPIALLSIIGFLVTRLI